jgi:hypothetical protein
MAPTIQRIFVDPPIAIARLGGSDTPQDAYRWVESRNPRSDGNTVIDPWWTLDVMDDGSVGPRMPTNVRFRDGELIRPVAPFFEIWASLGEAGSPSSKWRDHPLTPALLRAFGADETAVTILIEAKNRKAARRIVNPELVFGTFPPISVRADDHNVHALLGVNPPDAAIPMIPRGRNIPLGRIQVMRSRKQPGRATVAWASAVDVEVIRFRFTPARGCFYGPPEAARNRQGRPPAVDVINAFLDPDAGWFNKIPQSTVTPGDTYDTRTPDGSASLGVVDDTCEARVTVTLTHSGRNPTSLAAHANIFVAPPDFGPDRRPFLSLADELEDRGSESERRSTAMSANARDEWVEDLFERVYETVSLFNLDHFQNVRSIRLAGHELRREAIRGDKVITPRNHAMTNRDALRNDEGDKVSARSDVDLLPLSEHARTRHRLLQDIDALKEFVAENPQRLEALIRAPFAVERGETDTASSMRMPPFMRNSNAFPLTLSTWQYALLMAWVKAQRVARKQERAAIQMSSEAAQRRSAVLKRLPKRGAS